MVLSDMESLSLAHTGRTCWERQMGEKRGVPGLLEPLENGASVVSRFDGEVEIGRTGYPRWWNGGGEGGGGTEDLGA